MLEIIIVLLAVALDQAVKAFAAGWLTTLPNNSYPLLEGVFHLTYVENRGAAFGMLQNARWFFIAITIVACCAIVYWLCKNHKKLHTLMRVSLALILAGALGNLIDRIFLTYVRDMFYFVLVNFAVFNVADSAVTVGTALLILDVLFFKGKAFLQDEPKSKKGEETPALEEASQEEQPTGEEKGNAED
ncbi:MAG TPA: signal peptidase II [Clostridia bacterium]|nr:signal peptidase II [Clostridia bacterium]